MAIKIERKVYESEVMKCDDEKLILDHFISTEKQDDGGDIMRADGMIVRGRPVVKSGSNAGKHTENEPVAKPIGIRVGVSPSGSKGLIASTQFFDGSKLNPPDNTGQRLYQKAKQGFMPNWSIDYKAVDFTALSGGGRDVTKWLLLGYTQVWQGMNDEATTPEYKVLNGMGVDYKEDKLIPLDDQLATIEQKLTAIFEVLDVLAKNIDNKEKQSTAKSVIAQILRGEADGLNQTAKKEGEGEKPEEAKIIGLT